MYWRRGPKSHTLMSRMHKVLARAFLTVSGKAIVAHVHTEERGVEVLGRWGSGKHFPDNWHRAEIAIQTYIEEHNILD